MRNINARQWQRQPWILEGAEESLFHLPRRGDLREATVSQFNIWTEMIWAHADRQATRGSEEWHDLVLEMTRARNRRRDMDRPR